jgi:hypothetical protein
MNAAFLINPGLRKQFDAATARRGEGIAWTRRGWPIDSFAAIGRTWIDAAADVPYYRDLVATGSAPARIESWRDVAAVPVLTRRLLQDRPGEFIRRSGPPASFMTTAGSTGTPLRMGMDQGERDLMRVVKLAAWQAFGYDRSSRLFLIWGHAHLLGTGWKGRVNHLKRRLADAALGYRRVDAYRLTVESCAAHAEALIAFRPIGPDRLRIGARSVRALHARLPRAIPAAWPAIRAGHRRSAAASGLARSARRSFWLSGGAGVRRGRVRPGGVQGWHRAV